MFMYPLGNPDDKDFLLEFQGITTENLITIFKKKEIDGLLGVRLTMSDVTRCFPDPTQATVLHFVDPNGGSSYHVEGKKGFSSCAGICTVVFNCPRPNHVAVLGKFEFPTTNETEMNLMVHAYCRRMKENPFFESCRHLVGVEANYGGTIMASIYYNRFAQHFGNMLPYVPPPSTEEAGHRRGQHTGCGVFTTPGNKWMAGLFLTTDLRGGRLHLLDPVDSLERYVNQELASRTLVKDDLAASDRALKLQLERFCTRRGNHTAKGPHQNDDLLISIMMGAYWLRTHHQQRLALTQHMQSRVVEGPW
jgi:hypothetical protein